MQGHARRAPQSVGTNGGESPAAHKRVPQAKKRHLTEKPAVREGHFFSVGERGGAAELAGVKRDAREPGIGTFRVGDNVGKRVHQSSTRISR